MPRRPSRATTGAGDQPTSLPDTSGTCDSTADHDTVLQVREICHDATGEVVRNDDASVCMITTPL